MQITRYYQTLNPCYKQAKRMTPKGIVLHATGAANTSVGRYVGPADGILAPNMYNNHWNKATATKCVHAFIGTDKDDNIVCYQTLPWNIKPWGCGGGNKGSYNNSHIQFEICEDDRTDQEYFGKVYAMAVELCAFLCKKYNLKTSTIVSHDEAQDLGYASNHNDPTPWFKRFGKTMDTFREDVARTMGEVAPEPEEDEELLKLLAVNTPGDTLNVREDAVWTARKLGELEHGTTVEVYDMVDNGWVLIRQGKLRGWVNGGYLTAVDDKPELTRILKLTDKPYMDGEDIRWLQDRLNDLDFACGEADGIFGSRTDKAVKAFQEAKGLTQDGDVGPLTWAKL